ncbi:MAG: cytochrome b/b6 domain-containing protein [Desulfovibrionaceae bacterium]
MANTKRIYLFTRFERFWHWFQSTLIILLLLTGFEMHGTYTLFGFETAHTLHVYCAWAWLVLYAYVIFWMIVTNEWKQYVPTFYKLIDVVRYYAIGIFKGEPHPVPKSLRAKHNPLQRLTYLGIVSVLLPFQMATGFLVYYYNSWPALGITWNLEGIALLHTLGAFLVLQFLIVHVYMTTTGHSIFAHMQSMFTGWDEIDADQPIEEWETKSERL